MAEIYGLFSGRDGKVRYVGKTSGSRHTRFEQHLRNEFRPAAGGRYYYRSHVYGWIQHEWEACFPVQCALLDECSDEECDDLETEWMSRFPDLLNVDKYCYCGGMPPAIVDIREYMRRFVFNSGGYRGIHWWRQLDRYSVFVYENNSWRWLPGDGAPGWTGDIWFSDLNRALEAREEYRRGWRCRWLPDIEQEVDW